MIDPSIPRRERGSTGDPGDPKDCGLGTFASNQKGACNGAHYRTIGSVRLCRKHWNLVQAIKRDRNRLPEGRKPDTVVPKRVAA